MLRGKPKLSYIVYQPHHPLPSFGLAVDFDLSVMATPFLGDVDTPRSAPTCILGSVLVPGLVPRVSTSVPSGSVASALGQFSLNLHELEAAHVF